jgi:hypothetical protein
MPRFIRDKDGGYMAVTSCLNTQRRCAIVRVANCVVYSRTLKVRELAAKIVMLVQHETRAIPNDYGRDRVVFDASVANVGHRPQTQDVARPPEVLVLVNNGLKGFRSAAPRSRIGGAEITNDECEGRENPPDHVSYRSS